MEDLNIRSLDREIQQTKLNSEKVNRFLKKVLQGSLFKAEKVLTKVIEKSFEIKSTKKVTLLHRLCKLDNCHKLIKIAVNYYPINSQNTYGYTPLMYAILKGKLSNARILIENGADISIKNTFDETLLHVAAKTLKIESIRFLISSGLSILDLTRGGDSPLSLACLKGPTIEITKLLFHEDLAKRKNDRWITPFNYLIVNKKPDIGSVKLLLPYADLINFKNRTKGNYLHICCENNANIDIIKLLVEGKVEINSKDYFGNTPLHILCHPEKPVESILFLINAGADIGAQNDNGNTPLHLSFLKRVDFSTIEILLNAGADLSNENNFGKTPIDLNTNAYFPSEILTKFHSFNEDFLALFTRQEKCDGWIQTEDELIGFHKIFVKLRLGEERYIPVLEALQTKTGKLATEFLKFIYSGLYTQLSELKVMCEEFNIPFKEKSHKSGLVRDLKRFYEDDETKDFTIICGETRIKVHSVILLARSDLYRGMFISVNDDSNEVHDYTDRLPQTLQAFVKFLYTDRLDPNATQQMVEELEDAVDYYQLNPNTSFNEQVKALEKKLLVGEYKD